jgi:hypothetical protein
VLDDNVKGGSSTPWSRLKDPIRILSTPTTRMPGRGPAPEPGRTPGARAAKAQSVFVVLGIVIAIAGAVWVWRLERSFPLSLFVFVVSLIYVGIGLGDVATGTRRVRRFVVYTLLPVLCAGILIGTYRLWEMWWLAALLGFLGGLVAWAVLVAWWFPDILVEEGARTDVR